MRQYTVYMLLTASLLLPAALRAQLLEGRDLIAQPAWKDLKAALAAPDSVYKLSLYNQKLPRLPDQIGRLHLLQVLDLDNNELGRLPDSLCRLGHLQDLNLSRNYLESLPACLPQLKNLTTLSLKRNNKLINGATFVLLGKMPALESLDLSENMLKFLPKEALQLTRVKELNLTRNPDMEARILQSLAGNTGLASLDLTECGLRKLPLGLEAFNELAVLNLSGNPDLDLKDTFIRLQSMKNLRVLVMNGANIRHLPEEVAQLRQLEKLDLSYNELTTLPDELAGLSANTRLIFYNNGFTYSEKKRLKEAFKRIDF